MVFFSYLHIALEVLKNPTKFEIYKEGFSSDIYPGGRFRLLGKVKRNIRRYFGEGFPRNIGEWTDQQKKLLVDYGPITILYGLKKIKRIRGADIRRSKKKLRRMLQKCSATRYMRNNILVNSMSYEYETWEDYYRQLRKSKDRELKKRCPDIFSKRERHVVRKLKKHRKRSRKPLLILYGYSHDFGRYFDDQISYISSPVLIYAARCYDLNKTLHKDVFSSGSCASHFSKWLDILGHKKYFEGHLSHSTPSGENSLDVTSFINARMKLKGERQFGEPMMVSGLVKDYHEQGYSYLKKGQYDRAINALRSAIEIKPDYVSAINYLGLAYARKKNYVLSSQLYRRALSLNPEYAYSLNNLAWNYYKTGKAGEGLPYVQRAIQLKTQFASAYDTRAHIFEALGRYHEAIADYKMALSFNPSLGESIRGLKRVTSLLK